jgi:hypothetical protein
LVIKSGRQPLVALATKNLIILRGREGHVLIDFISCAQVAQVPVKGWSKLSALGGNSGHHNIAAIARIAEDDESPVTSRKSLGLGADSSIL